MVDLMQLLEDTVDRESWRDNGGNIGAIRATGSLLVIQQTRKAHGQIQQILNDSKKIKNLLLEVRDDIKD